MKSFRNGGSFKMIDLKGVKSGMLTALFPVRQDKWGCYFWLCKCDCGKECEVSATRINKGETKSCGCLKLKKGQNEKHGLKKHPLYSVWAGMKYRCYNVKSHNYPLYGGRGITVCDRWLQSVVNFYEDMIDGYVKGLHLDRINNDGNYEPTNCRWLTHTQNSNNKRNNVYICMDGRTHTPAEWGRELNIKDNTIANRKRKGWVDYDTLFGLK
jgi:hypothetical protein